MRVYYYDVSIEGIDMRIYNTSIFFFKYHLHEWTLRISFALFHAARPCLHRVRVGHPLTSFGIFSLALAIPELERWS